MRKTIEMLKNESGAALMMAIFTVTTLMVIATEIMYETSVEYVVSSQVVNQLKAHYAAKAGVQISLLRLHIYRKVVAAMGEDMVKQMPMVDMIWKAPFAWPPILPEGASRTDREEVKAKVKISTMTAQYMATMESEGNKIDLTNLGSESEQLRNVTMKELESIFAKRMQDDEDFAQKHSGEDFHKFVNNIKDWVDADEKNDLGGDERSLYQGFGDSSRFLPPNRPFMTFEELHLVAGMTDEYFKMLLPKITIFGTKAINIKYASKDLIKSLFNLNDEQIGRLLEERDKKDTTIFKDEQTFYQFLQGLGVRIEQFKDKENKPTIHISFGSEFNFRIKSVGSSGKVQREITAIVYDYDQVLAQLRKLMPQPTATPVPGAPPQTVPTPIPTPTPDPKKGSTTVPNESPNIVYWIET
jgi:general secretion pathway protein K